MNVRGWRRGVRCVRVCGSSVRRCLHCPLCPDVGYGVVLVYNWMATSTDWRTRLPSALPIYSPFLPYLTTPRCVLARGDTQFDTAALQPRTAVKALLPV
jgi:hypothetical protein